MLIGIIIAVLVIGAASFVIYELTRPTSPPQTSTWRPTVDAPGDNHATPSEAETPVEPVESQESAE